LFWNVCVAFDEGEYHRETTARMIPLRHTHGL
jgi:hypothetical protein